jgi:hypothetical protein
MIAVMRGRAAPSGTILVFKISVISSPELGFGQSNIVQSLKMGSIPLKASSMFTNFAPIAAGLSIRPYHLERMEYP